ncbi:MAG: cobalamin B12-binding domain-containing protein, partial [Desulfobacterales bacterium]|nr:cobalamin B12-binding domain-containing protein [Desulfobacterales bacterium]
MLTENRTMPVVFSGPMGYVTGIHTGHLLKSKWSCLKKILLINPPVAKPSEPPAGIARLAGALRHNNLECRVIDASLGGLHFLLNKPVEAKDTWTRRAVGNRFRHLRSLQAGSGYVSFDRYKRAVADIGRVLEKAVPDQQVKIGLANYRDLDLSPVRSQDILKAAANPEANPFYDYYREAILPAAMDPAVTAVGISLSFLSQALCGFALIGLLKRERADLGIILGGGLVTSWMRQPEWKNPFGELVDHMVDGPGEEVLLKMLGKTGETSTWVPDYSDFEKNRYF